MMPAEGFKIRVGVVVLDDRNRMLLARQNQRDFWVLPGGTLEPGETIGECAVREIREEANLEIERGPLLYVSDFFAPSKRQILDIVFLGHLKGGILERETTENIDDIGFFTIEEAKGMLVRPTPVFQSLFQYWVSENWPTQDTVYLGSYA